MEWWLQDGAVTLRVAKEGNIRKSHVPVDGQPIPEDAYSRPRITKTQRAEIKESLATAGKSQHQILQDLAKAVSVTDSICFGRGNELLQAQDAGALLTGNLAGVPTKDGLQKVSYWK